MASSSSSHCLSLTLPTYSLSENWDYDVFPSFHGPDVRKTFLSHVMKEFTKKTITLFIDNQIKRGEFIGPELKRAIIGSKIAVVFLSRNYASSPWCLDELVEIIKKKELGQIVITIFYEVDPTEIKKQTGHFGKVFQNTCEGKDKEKTETWRKALESVATIAGYHSSAWANEASMIENIAADILDMLNRFTPSRDFENFVGMEKHMERLKPLLCLDLDEQRMIGIWGPSGSGKTTIVRFLFNELSSHFQNSALMEDIKGNYPKLCFDEYEAKLQLQNKMLSKMINQRDTTMISHLGVAQERLRNKKVFLVLDDVDRLAQLDALTGNVQWFGPGSRVIITTEDRRLLKATGVNHIYKVDFPSNDEALQMFCMYVFQRKSPDDGFHELSREITYLVGELPLGLKVIGSYFRGLSKDKKQWSIEVSRLRTNLNGDIKNILKFSYDALCDEDKELFLLIACFFKGEDIRIMEKFLADKFKDLRQRLSILEEKSLTSVLSIVEEDSKSRVCYEYIQMHKLLVHLGQEIVRKESDSELGQHQVLNDYKHVCQVITGSRSITASAFEGKLRVKYDSGHPIFISWLNFPFPCLRFTNNLEFLVELRLSHSKLEKLWEGTKMLQNLRMLDLSYSTNLKELPNLSMAINLEELNLKGCSSLIELHSSIRNAVNLQKLNLAGCSNLVELPFFICDSTNFQELNVEGCSNLVELPSSIWSLANLTKLNLKECSSLVKLPCSIWNAATLTKLNLEGCSSLVELPSSIWNATNIQELILKGCSSLIELPSSIGNATNLEKLDLRGCSSLVELPSSIWNATNLEELDLKGCSSLMGLPSFESTTSNLEELHLSGCSSLMNLFSSIRNATNLHELKLEGCSNLVKLPFSVWNKSNLEKLNLSGCSSLVELPSSIWISTNLRELNLEGCSSLMKVPYFFWNATNLEKLNLGGCSSLAELPFSIKNASNLQVLNLRGCSSLVNLPFSVWNAANLEELNLSYCSSLVEIPSSIGNATNLEKLYLRGCSSLVEIPSSIWNATNLEKLDLSDCSSLVEIPSSIRNAINLEKLNLGGCSSLVELPFDIGTATNLRELILEGCSSLVEIPSSIGNATNLKKLNLRRCSSLVELPSSLRNTTNLKELHLNQCSSLVSLPQLPESLSELDATDCESLMKLDCSFRNPVIKLSFSNCFNLNKEARDLLIQTSTLEYVILPGKEVPACFTYRASGSIVTVKLNQNQRSTSTIFKACVVLVNKEENEYENLMTLRCSVHTSKHKKNIAAGINRRYCLPIETDHLYIFDVKLQEVPSNELNFKFNISYWLDEFKTWEIKEGGILSTLGA